MVLKTAREVNVGSAVPGNGLERLKEIDDRWAEPVTWSVIRRALPASTDFYLLASVDLRRNAQGSIVAASDDNAIYRDVIARTFAISASVTLICLLLGYPLAYWIATAPPRTARLLLLMVLLPFWTSLLVRTTAWVVVLQSGGVVNSLLGWLGLVDPQHPLELIHNRIGVLIAMTHILLPFMVLPIYSVMKGIPPNYMRAAASLGAPPGSAFLRVYLPLSLPGVSAGCLLVFILALGYYITPALVGGPQDQMLSYFIAYFASQVTNWGMAAALSATLLVLVLLLYALYHRLVGIDKLRMG
jgi:putative spermidine/putrescine transport system permease protein